MENVRVDQQNLEIAIQTVLHLYQSDLELLFSPQKDAFIKEMAIHISRQAHMFQNLSETMAAQLEAQSYEL
ncbi:MAG: hypothetical protein K0R67_2812 [Paenibacillus sp.]|jgi:hypothetical protein|nr:hypothetical protein [Paenibacillus sp.]